MTNAELIEKAKKTMENAYSPYSQLRVGAALLTASGDVYTGCNVENASYGATICAERTAILKAVSEGERSFDRMAIVSSSNEHTYPCGLCLQVLAEFMYDGTLVFDSETKGIAEIPVKDCLPKKFNL